MPKGKGDGSATDPPTPPPTHRGDPERPIVGAAAASWLSAAQRPAHLTTDQARRDRRYRARHRGMFCPQPWWGINCVKPIAMLVPGYTRTYKQPFRRAVQRTLDSLVGVVPDPYHALYCQAVAAAVDGTPYPPYEWLIHAGQTIRNNARRYGS